MSRPVPSEDKRGWRRTCWRGIEVGHPADWEEAFLCGPDQPGQIAWADRRFQRLQVNWQALPREPDLGRMYKDLAKTFSKHQSKPLSHVPGWTGVVRQEFEGCITFAGRYFPGRKLLVQTVLTWPKDRDERLERAVLASISPQEEAEALTWSALGLEAAVPFKFEMVEQASKVGQVGWTFSAVKPARTILVERLAMPEHWLKGELAEWVKDALSEGFKAVASERITVAGHAGCGVFSRRGNPLVRAARLAVYRLDRAWLCPAEQRVYHVAYWQRARSRPEWPEGLAVVCHPPTEPAQSERV